MSLLVSGSRTIKDKDYVFSCLNYTKRELFNFDTIIEGEAGWHKEKEKRKISVDLLSRLFAKENNLELVPMKAEWKRFGNVAGFMRNSEMIKLCQYGIAIWDGKSKGTEDTIKKLIDSDKILQIFLYIFEQNALFYALKNYNRYINSSFIFRGKSNWEKPAQKQIYEFI
jgi:hypothetical protein